MWRKSIKLATAFVAVLMLVVPLIQAQSIDQESRDQANQPNQPNDQANSDRQNSVRIDRYLDAEIWTNHNDNEFYENDNIVLNYRVSRDAFVAIYSIDSRGNVRLLFPTDPNQDNFVRGGETYRLPSGDDNFDLVVNGPAGTESIQMVASQERFPIPNWYHNSGLVADNSDRDDYMDYLDNTYFVRYSGQRFSYDRVAVSVNEWEPDYFRPVYAPVYPSWAVCGNMYIDYPWGSSVYINGSYWGCTPLYVPWILCGWHTVTVYDRFGYCWENDIHVSRYNTVVLNRTVIHTNPGVVSKFKEVQVVGFRDPAKNGYPNFAQVVAKEKTVVGAGRVATPNVVGKGTGSVSQDNFVDNLPKKYARGDAKLIKTDRGYETDAINATPNAGRGYTKRSYGTATTTTQTPQPGSYEAYKKSVQGESNRNGYTPSNTAGKSNGTSDGYYQRKTGGTPSSGGGTNTPSVRGKREGSTAGGNSGGSSAGAARKTGGGEKSGAAQPKGNGGGGKSTRGGGGKEGR